MLNNGLLEIKGLRFSIAYGAHPTEWRYLTPLIIDLGVSFSYPSTPLEDNLESTVDYAAVCSVISTSVKDNAPFKTLEFIAQTIKKDLEEQLNSDAKVRFIKVCKPNPPIDQQVELACIRFDF